MKSIIPTKYQEIEGNLITLALSGEFDVIAHGCNCFSTMGAGIAPQMAKAFECDLYPMERDTRRGKEITKLGNIDFGLFARNGVKPAIFGKNYIMTESSAAHFNTLYVVNAYTQFNYGKNHEDGYEKPVDYYAILMCFKKMNHIFKGMHIGLPQIGCGLAGGDWGVVKGIIKEYLPDCNVTVVMYDGS